MLNNFVVGLPASYSSRPLYESEATTALRVVREFETSILGSSDVGIEEITGDYSSVECGWERGAVLVSRDLEPIGVGVLFFNPESGRDPMADIFVSHSITPGEGQQVCDALLCASQTYAVSLDHELARRGAFLKVGIYEEDTVLSAALSSANFEIHRYHLRMRIELSKEIQPRIPDGFNIRTFDGSDEQWKTIHYLSSTSFLDHYDFRPLPFEVFKHQLSGGSQDHSQWRMMYSPNAEPVGYCMGTNRYASDGCGYVGSIGTLRGWRKHGVATALLHDAFERDRRFGRHSTLLHCDSSSLTGANLLYESEGMHADRVYSAWRREITN